jgi:hypothetical protein
LWIDFPKFEIFIVDDKRGGTGKTFCNLIYSCSSFLGGFVGDGSFVEIVLILFSCESSGLQIVDMVEEVEGSQNIVSIILMVSLVFTTVFSIADVKVDLFAAIFLEVEKSHV